VKRSFHHVLCMHLALQTGNVCLGWHTSVGQSVPSSVAVLQAPSDQSFDTESIRPSDPSREGFDIRPDANNFSVHGATLKYLVQLAYDLHDFQIQGGPQWMASSRYDVHAKSELPHSDEDSELSEARLRRELQDLLRRRFDLKLHQAVQVQSIYRLTVAKGKGKLMPGTENKGYMAGPGVLKCSFTTMADLAALLSDSTDRPVLDETQLTGAYAFTLHWTPGMGNGPGDNEPDLFTALNEQLGLRLISGKAPTPVLVIDSAEKPSAN
jgi:uncharacterized protein (TIGR03435 family)